MDVPKGWWFKPTRGRLSFNFLDSQIVSAPSFSVFQAEEKKKMAKKLDFIYVINSISAIFSSSSPSLSRPDFRERTAG